MYDGNFILNVGVLYSAFVVSEVFNIILIPIFLFFTAVVNSFWLISNNTSVFGSVNFISFVVFTSYSSTVALIPVVSFLKFFI